MDYAHQSLNEVFGLCPGHPGGRDVAGREGHDQSSEEEEVGVSQRHDDELQHFSITLPSFLYTSLYLLF